MHTQNVNPVQSRLHRPADGPMNPVSGILFTRQRSYKAFARQPRKDHHAKAVKQG